MTGEEIGREKKAKRMTRAIIGETIGVLKALDDSGWFQIAVRVGVAEPSEATRNRVIELLEEIAI